MLILERYIFREVLWAFTAVFLLIVVVFMSNRFVWYLSYAAAGKMGGGMVFRVLAMELGAQVALVMVPSFFLGVFLALARMYREHEITVIRSSGPGIPFILRSVAKLSILFSLVVALFSLYLSPASESAMRELKREMRSKTNISIIQPGRFTEFSGGDRVLYVEDMSEDRESLENVFLQVREKEHLGVLTSEGAELQVDTETGDRYVVFTNGNRYIGKPGQLDYSIVEYEKYGVRFSRNQVEPYTSKLVSTSTPGLFELGSSGAVAELQWRASLPLVAILSSLLAVMLGSSTSSRGRYTGFLIAAAGYYLYTNLLAISKSMVSGEEISPYLGLWWVHALLALLVAGLFYYPAMRGW